MALWEAGSVGGAVLLTGAAITALVGWLIRTRPRDVPGQALTVPWLPLAAIAAACVGLTLLAALVGSRSAHRA